VKNGYIMLCSNIIFLIMRFCVKKKNLLLFCTVIVFVNGFISCDKSTDSDNSGNDNGELGGQTDIDLNKIGTNYDVFFPFPERDRIKDSTIVTKNENGLVTYKHRSVFDTVFFRALEKSLGLNEFPSTLRKAALDMYLKKYNATLDSTDKMNIKLTAEFKARVTSEGIQEYFSSKNDYTKPKTIVAYSWNVGLKYQFTDAEGGVITREVVSKSVTDDYPLGFMFIKVIQVEETKKDDPIVEKMTWIANHKFGLVGIHIKMKNGKELQLGIF